MYTTEPRPIARSIRVLNVAFEKNVSVHYSTDGWQTSSDVTAVFLASSDASSDRFTASIPLLAGRDAIDLVLRYEVSCTEFGTASSSSRIPPHVG